MAWLYVSSKPWVVHFSERHTADSISAAEAHRRLIDQEFVRRQGEKGHETARDYFGGGGSGGGGADEDWVSEVPDPMDPGTMYAVGFGDPDCPPSGLKRAWYYSMSHPSDSPRMELGPHNNGPFTTFVGFNGFVANSNTSTYAQWLPVDNNANALQFPTGTAPNCSNGYGLCDLPDPATAPLNRNYWENWIDLGSKQEGVPNPDTDSYNQTVGNWWVCQVRACVPQHYGVIFMLPPPDRRKVRNARTEEGGSAPVPAPLPLVPPPFVYGVPVTPGPHFPPKVSRGSPRTRRPPRARVRERKKASTIQKIFRVLDALSESAEIVDCVYSALPKATRKRWEKANKPDKSRGLVDTAGQYGIDGADWKGPAIWHNADSVDWNEAFKCVLLNELEDKIIGGIARQLPPGAGGLVTGGLFREKAIRQGEIDRQKWAAIRAENAARVRAGKGGR